MADSVEVTGGFGPAEVARALRLYEERLEAVEADLNALNVFPVADHDTGTNLLATVRGAVAELGGSAADADADALSRVVGRAALTAARGNSGLIMGQYLSGFTRQLADGAASAGAGTRLARCLQAGAAAARNAVAEPVEGTILTVADAVADAAVEEVEAGVCPVAAEAVRAGQEAVSATTEQLDVLAQAGFVDAGAVGFVEFLVAVEHAVDPQPIDALRHRVPAGGPAPLGPIIGWEIMFRTAGDEAEATIMRDRLKAIGSDVVVGHADCTIAAHVHVDVDRLDSAVALISSWPGVRELRREPLVES